MEHKEILPVLYDLSVTIGGEVRVKSLLTRTLQRLLYHTSFSAGFVCLDMPPCEGVADAKRTVRIQAAVGDFELIAAIDKDISVPCELIYGCSSVEVEQQGLLSQLSTTHSHYKSYLRLPVGEDGVIILLAMHLPDTNLNLPLILQPVLTQLAKAVTLCRTHDAQEEMAKVKQQQLQQSLQQVESQFRSLIELSPIGVALSSDGVVIDGNSAFLAMFGYDEIAQLQGHPLTELIAPQKRAEIIERIRLRAQGQPVPDTYETIGSRSDRSQFPFLVSVKRVETEQGARTFTFCIDLTEQKRAEQQLRSVNDMMRAVLETVPVRIFWKDTESRYLGCNPAFAHDAGLSSPAELIGKDDTQMGWKDQAALYREDDRQVMISKKPKLNFEEPQTTPDGHQIWLRTSKVPLQDREGEVIGILGIYDDVTEQKNAEAQIHQLAYFDSLTDLPNRRLLQDRLQQAMAVSVRSRHYGALIFLDLDDFKSLNDSKGHSVGDRLLIEVGQRLIANVRDGDTVARLGGDEFVVILENLSNIASEAATQSELVAEKIRSALCERYQFDELEVRTTPSIGIVLFQNHHDSLDSLLQHADTAMYQAKQAGRNTIRFFDPEMQAELEERLSMADDLRSAIDNKQLQLYFQKQVDAEGRAVGAEALLRWNHPQRGMVAPGKFIPLAEETGIIIPVGLWVFHSACAQLKLWQRSPATRDLTLAVNVSAKQFRKKDFVDQVRRVLVETGAKPSHLKLELTESTVLENVEDTIAKMRELKLLGISFSMDDFGTGYSSLQYLKSLPLDQIKIDQSFVRDIATDPNDAAIVQTIIAMTEALGLNVIAEGVETREQQEFLEQRGCHTFQGYFFGRPVPLSQFEVDLQKGRP
jgi:diguanylate cyclase (GGDEF)-like protein/PAS domain S-box-containing protein